ncbi:MAG: ABC transporter ATP-binding protein, partial [Acidimicrobiales bacterium]
MSPQRRGGNLRAAATALGLGWKAGKLRALSVVAIVVASQASGIAVAAWLRSLLDAAIAGHSSGVVVAAVGAALTMFVSFLGYVRGYDAVRLPLREDIARDTDEELMRVFSTGPGLEVQERADILDAGETVRTHRGDLSDAFEDLVTWLALVAQLLAGVVLLASIEPWLAVLIFFAVPSALATRAADRVRSAALAEAAPELRHARHLESLVTRTAPAREVRVFGLAPVLTQRHAEAWRRASTTIDGAEARGVAATSFAWAVFVLGYALTILIVVRAAADGRASAGDVVLSLALAAQFSSQVQGIIRNGQFLLIDLQVAGAYRFLVGLRRNVIRTTATSNGP